MKCGQSTRWDGPCKLDAGHKGHHAFVAFVCDGCGKARRGQPHTGGAVMVGGEQDDYFSFCFLCSDERVIGRA
jgi:hypothetical protein